MVGVVADDRTLALDFALKLVPDVTSLHQAPEVVSVAEEFYTFLTATVRLAVTVTIDRIAVGPFSLTRNGAHMPTIAVAATDDNTTITFAVDTEDDHQQPTADQLTVTTDDTAATVGTLTVNPDTHGAVVTLNHVEGSFNVTFADPSAPGVEDLVFAVNIGAGATAALTGTATVA
jgi:hypothetical protein